MSRRGMDPRFSPCQRQFTGAIRCISTTMVGRSETELTTAQLTLITDEGSVNEKQETFIVPMRNAGELTLVKSFDW